MSKLLTETNLQAWIKAGKPIAGKSENGLTFTLSRAGCAAWTFR